MERGLVTPHLCIAQFVFVGGYLLSYGGVRSLCLPCPLAEEGGDVPLDEATGPRKLSEQSIQYVSEQIYTGIA